MRQGEVAETSLITVRDCQNVFESILKEGKDLLYIGFSSALSGTYNVAAMVARDLREAYPGGGRYMLSTRLQLQWARGGSWFTMLQSKNSLANQSKRLETGFLKTSSDFATGSP